MPDIALTRLSEFEELNHGIVACRTCSRLVDWREKIGFEKKRSFQEDTYWAKAVPNFGDPEALRLIVGLAPAAHGANRTGRMFTGDRSGDWLYRALYKAGVANQPNSTRIEDGLHLTGVLITAVCHCAPPDNKPLLEEIKACAPYLLELLNSRSWRSILCLGNLAWDRTHRALGAKAPKFGHSVVSTVSTSDGDIKLVGSYHPSQQNTFTGRLTEAMLDDAIRKFLSD